MSNNKATLFYTATSVENLNLNNIETLPRNQDDGKVDRKDEKGIEKEERRVSEKDNKKDLFEKFMLFQAFLTKEEQQKIGNKTTIDNVIKVKILIILTSLFLLGYSRYK